MPTGPSDPPASRGVFAKRMLLLSLGTLLSRVLGMLRETLIAATFPVAATDAFFVAWRIPNSLRALLSEGALSSAFVPVLSETLQRGDKAFTARTSDKSLPALPAGVDERDALLARNGEALREALARIRAASLLALIPTTLLGMLFAPQVMAVTAGDFGGDAHRLTLATGLLRVLFPYIFFMGSAAVGIAALQTVGRYGALAFAPAALNVAFLIAPFAFVPLAQRAGYDGVYGLAAGAILGGALQLLALVPSLRRHGLTPRPALDLRHPAVRRAGVLIAPTLFGLAIYQVDVILSNRFLAGLPAGATSFFSYAQRIADIPQGLFILSITGAHLPELSSAFAAGNRARAEELTGQMIRVAAFVAVPTSVLLATWGEAIVPVIYGYGRFASMGGRGVAEVVASLRWQAAGVALLALVRQLTACFNAAQDTRTPVWISAVDLCAFIALALALRGPMGHPGVAAAITGSTAVQLALLVARSKKHVSLPWGPIASTLARVAVASAAMGLLARAVVARVDLTGPGLAPKLLAVVGAAALGTVYLVAAWLLRIDELREVTARLTRRLRRRR